MTATRDTVRRIWDEDSGTRIEVRPDPDGLGLIDLCVIDEEPKVAARVSVTKAQAPLLAAALLEAAAEKDPE